MNDKERRIKEARTAEALKKNLMGAGGKFGCIVRNLGGKIESHGSGLYDSNPIPDYEDLGVDDGGVADWGDVTARHVGWVYDGLGGGMHLEITYLDDDKSLGVSYKGESVYKEVAGDLHCYAPHPDWESLIEKLYRRASKIESARRRVDRAEEKAEGKRVIDEFLQYLKKRWGV